mmetsp:Transcript_2359/g.15766  ORF Transcript_2359/g.15766 Transcript_2359/m.15766 type:complete len:214 (+) Transcript_2359:3510-4151(+)
MGSCLRLYWKMTLVISSALFLPFPAFSIGSSLACTTCPSFHTSSCTTNRTNASFALFRIDVPLRSPSSIASSRIRPGHHFDGSSTTASTLVFVPSARTFPRSSTRSTTTQASASIPFASVSFAYGLHPSSFHRSTSGVRIPGSYLDSTCTNTSPSWARSNAVWTPSTSACVHGNVARRSSATSCWSQGRDGTSNARVASASNRHSSMRLSNQK